MMGMWDPEPVVLPEPSICEVTLLMEDTETQEKTKFVLPNVPGENLMGRSPDQDVKIKSPSVPKTAARIRVGADVVTIEAINEDAVRIAKGGGRTGRPLVPQVMHKLENAHSFTIGKVRFTLHFQFTRVGAAAAPPASEASGAVSQDGGLDDEPTQMVCDDQSTEPLSEDNQVMIPQSGLAGQNCALLHTIKLPGQDWKGLTGLGVLAPGRGGADHAALHGRIARCRIAGPDAGPQDRQQGQQRQQQRRPAASWRPAVVVWKPCCDGVRRLAADRVC